MTALPQAPDAVVNFGGNVEFRPAAVAAPRSEAEVLQFLSQFRGRRIRAVGRLHSWSQAAVADDILIDLRHVNEVRLEQDGGQVFAVIGGGCQISRALAELDRQGGYTLPSIGLISEQTIAGAISTGTHGSGKHSLSHYVAEVRLAMYDAATGEPVMLTISSGDELRAARCALGCLGIIVAVKVPVVPHYFVEEHLREYRSLEDVLAAEQPFPLQQFFLVPWRWTYLAQHRREVPGQRSKLATLYRWYWFAVIDVGLHVWLKIMVQLLRSPALVRSFYRLLVLLFVIRGWRVVDRAADQLIMEHELFRHIEIELFVQRSKLAAALDFVRDAICQADGGTYTHHYAICVRKVLPDDTLISMSAGLAEPSYAISLISYVRPGERAGFYHFAEHLAQQMGRQFDARPHWGKVCPLTAGNAARLYPRLSEFREICRRLDPRGMLRNAWTSAVLFGEGSADSTNSRAPGTPPTATPRA